MTDLQKQLFALQDEKYREFHCRLIPGVDEDRVIGIRVPVLRKWQGQPVYGTVHSTDAKKIYSSGNG